MPAKVQNNGFRFRNMRKIAAFAKKFGPRLSTKILNLIYSPHRRKKNCFDVAIDYDNDLLINVNTSSFVEWTIFVHGHYERDITNIIKRILRPGMVALDIGANIGCHTLIMSRAAGGSGQVFAFEPHPEVRRKLLKNLALNRIQNVEAISSAISDARGKATLYSFDEGSSNQATSSLLKDNSSANAPKYEVDTLTLDEFVKEKQLQRLDFIKIDTEGNESRILKSGMDTIKKFRPHVVFEYNCVTWQSAEYSFDKIKQAFYDMNYSLNIIRTQYLANVEHTLPVMANILAVPEK